MTDSKLEVYLTADVLQHGGVKQIPLVRQSDAKSQIAALAAEVMRLREALEESRNAIMSDLNAHSIVCTVWVAPSETLVDYIDTALKGGAA